MVVGYFLFKKIKGYPYTKGREIYVPVSGYTKPRPEKKESLYDRLEYRYEDGAVVLIVPNGVLDFDYRIISFDRDRDTAIRRAEAMYSNQ